MACILLGEERSSWDARFSNLPANSSALTVSVSGNMDTTVLVLSPLGKQVVVSAELGPEEEVGLRLLFLPRLKVEATSGGASRLSCFFSGKRDKGLRSGLLMWWKNPNSGLWPGLRSSWF